MEPVVLTRESTRPLPGSRRLAPWRAALDQPRSLASWVLAHGLQKALIERNARTGDLISRLVSDPALRADPFDAYEELRSRGPITANQYVSGSVDHAVCNEVLRSDAFGVAGTDGQLPGPVQWLLRHTRDDDTLGPIDRPSMLAVDPPQHTRYRQQVARAFTARKVGRLSDRVGEVADTLLDDIERRAVAGRLPAGGARFDLITEYAGRLPVTVIADLLGVPEADRDRLLVLGNEAAVTLDPGLTLAEFRRAERALRELHTWFRGHVQRLAADPGDDLLSQLVKVEGPDRLDPVELHQVGLLVLAAGFETTVNLIGNAVALLDAHPDQLGRLLAEPDLWPNAVDEVLRLQAPVQLTMRIAQRTTEVAGRRFERGHGVLLYLAGANRDPEVFDDPARFDVARPNADQHLSFSAGVHFCLGSSLARLEAAVALRRLYERYPDLRLAGPGRRRPTRVLRGFEHLPVAAGGTSSTSRL